MLLTTQVTVGAVEAPPAPLSEAPNAPQTALDGLSWQMRKIAQCESGMRQFNADGSILRGRLNPKDVGLFQINEFYHLHQSQELGMDIYTLEGNIAYAKWLVSVQGYQPWIHSNPCHHLL